MGRSLLCVGVCWLTVSAAFAQDEPRSQEGKFYVGVGASTLKFEDEFDGIDLKDRSAGLGVYAGFRVRDNVLVEVYWDTFDAIDRQNVLGSGVVRFDATTERRTLSASVLREVSLNDLFNWRRDWRVYGALGFYSSALERSATDLASGETVRVEDDVSGLLIGAGVLYRMRGFDVRGYARWFGVLDRNEASEVGVAAAFTF